MTYGGTRADDHARLRRLRQRRHRLVADHTAGVLDHGDQLEPGRRLALPVLVQRGGRLRTTRSATSPGSVTVGKAPLTITASSAIHDLRRDGAHDHGGLLGLRQRRHRLVPDDHGATCSTTATSSSPVAGSPYASSCSGAVDANYTISYVPGSVTVGKAPLTITASSPSMTYGGTVPTITPGYAGFVNGDSASSLTPAADVLDDGDSSSPSRLALCVVVQRARSTRTTPSATSPARSTVGKAPLTITASSGSMTYGGSVPTITAGLLGLRQRRQRMRR